MSTFTGILPYTTIFTILWRLVANLLIHSKIPNTIHASENDKL